MVEHVVANDETADRYRSLAPISWGGSSKVEHRTCNAGVMGSSPILSTIFGKQIKRREHGSLMPSSSLVTRRVNEID